MPFNQLSRALLRTMVPAAAMWLLAACGEDATGPRATPVPVFSVEITTPRAEIVVGESHDFDAVARGEAGQPLADRSVTWQSENETIATISATGVLVARASGTVGIVAASEGKRTRFELRVIAPNAAPTLDAISPSILPLDMDESVSLIVRGTGFIEQSVIRVNGTARTTAYVSSTELRTMLTPNDARAVGAQAVTVVTPAPGGGTSASLQLVVEMPEPGINAMQPNRIVMGWGMSFTVTLTGFGFTGATQLFVDNVARAIDQRTPTTIAFRLSPADVRTARTIAVRVVNAAPGGGSASANFEVQSVPVATVQLSFEWEARWTWEGLRLPVRAIPRSATTGDLFDRVAQWSISPATVGQVIPVSDREGAVVGVAAGTATLHATVDGVRSADASIRVFAKPTYDVLYSGGINGDRHIARWPIGTGNAPYRLNLGMMAMHPAPSPDGRHFAFTGFSEAFPTPELYIASADGREIRRLTSDNAVDQYPAWSPDGARIAFESTRAGLVNIFTMRTDGTDVKQLTFARLADPLPGSGQGASRPVWSPDGQQIAYTSGANGIAQLWVMNADGSNKRRLTNPEVGGDYDAAWTADGREILVRREVPAEGGVSLLRVNVATGGFVQLNVVPLLYGWTPSYSPDGEWLIMSEAGSMQSPALIAAPARLPTNALYSLRKVLPAFWVGGVRDARWIRR